MGVKHAPCRYRPARRDFPSRPIVYGLSLWRRHADCTSQDAVGLVVPGDPGVPAGMTTTYYKAFAPRIGIAWSPGSSGKTSIRAGWGLFYNPMEQLVLAQFGAEPPFGGSSASLRRSSTCLFSARTVPRPIRTRLTELSVPNAGPPQDWASFEPIDLFGDFQPHLRTQYSAQYNLTIQRELSRDMKLEIGYVGSQGHRLLATHDLNYSNPQTCVDISNIAANATVAASRRVMEAFRRLVGSSRRMLRSSFSRGTVLPDSFALALCAKPFCYPCRHDGWARRHHVGWLASVLVAAM